MCCLDFPFPLFDCTACNMVRSILDSRRSGAAMRAKRCFACARAFCFCWLSSAVTVSDGVGDGHSVSMPLLADARICRSTAACANGALHCVLVDSVPDLCTCVRVALPGGMMRVPLAAARAFPTPSKSLCDETMLDCALCDGRWVTKSETASCSLRWGMGTPQTAHTDRRASY